MMLNYRLLGAQLALQVGLARRYAPTSAPTYWCGHLLAPEEIYCGLVRSPEAVSRLLGCHLTAGREVCGSTALLLDLAGVVGARLPGFEETWSFSLREDELCDGVLASCSFGGFDVVVIVLDAFQGEPGRDKRSERLMTLRSHAASAPWLVIGVGPAGPQDPMLAHVRSYGIPLMALEAR